MAGQWSEPLGLDDSAALAMLAVRASGWESTGPSADSADLAIATAELEAEFEGSGWMELESRTDRFLVTGPEGSVRSVELDTAGFNYEEATFAATGLDWNASREWELQRDGSARIVVFARSGREVYTVEPKERVVEELIGADLEDAVEERELAAMGRRQPKGRGGNRG